MSHSRGYRAHLHDGTVIDLQAEGMWPSGTQLEWTITTLVIGLPRQVVVQRCNRTDVDLVLRDDGAGVAAGLSPLAMAQSRPRGTSGGPWVLVEVACLFI